MDFIDQLQSLAQLIEKQKAGIITEEATKKAFVLPFIRLLGCDISDSRGVVADFSAESDCKNDGSVDYAVCVDGKPLILFDCRSCTMDLTREQPDQLRNSFDTSSARFGVLTNGISYRFYTDYNKRNIMDDQPFWELNLLDIDEEIIPELTKFSKKNFDLDQVFSEADGLRYIQAIKDVLFEASSSPSLEAIHFFANHVYPGKKTEQILNQFQPIVKEAFNQFINDKLQSLMNDREEELVADNYAVNNACLIESGTNMVVTDEEFEGFFVVNVT